MHSYFRQLNLRLIFLSILLFITLQPQISLSMQQNRDMSDKQQKVLNDLNSPSSGFNLALKKLFDYKATVCVDTLAETITKVKKELTTLKTTIGNEGIITDEKLSYELKRRQLVFHPDKITNKIKSPIDKKRNQGSNSESENIEMDKESNEINELINELSQQFTRIYECATKLSTHEQQLHMPTDQDSCEKQWKENLKIKIDTHQIAKESIVTNVINHGESAASVAAKAGSSDEVSNKFSLWLQGLSGKYSVPNATTDYKRNIFGFVAGLDYNFNSNFSVGLFDSLVMVDIKNSNLPLKDNDYTISEAIGVYSKYRMKQLSLSALGMMLATEEKANEGDVSKISYILDVRANYDILLTQNLFLTPILGFEFCHNTEFLKVNSSVSSRFTANNIFNALFGASLSKQLLINNYSIAPEIHAIRKDPYLNVGASINNYSIVPPEIHAIRKDPYLNVGASVKNQNSYNEITFGLDNNIGANKISTTGYLEINITL